MSELAATPVVVTKPDGGSVQVLIDGSVPVEGTRTTSTDTTLAAILETVFTVFDPDRTLDPGLGKPFAILPRNLAPQSVPPSIQDYLRQLTVCANAAAAALACGSILAGHTSEADEYGDISFWLGEGEYDNGHELEVLQSLALRGRIAENVGLKEVKMSTKTGLPTTVNVPTNASAEVAALIGLLRRMSAIRVFCLRGELSVYVLVGRYSTGGTSGWCGLLGLGVQS